MPSPLSFLTKASFRRLTYLPNFKSPSARPLGSMPQLSRYSSIFWNMASQYSSECSMEMSRPKSPANSLLSQAGSYFKMQTVISLPIWGRSDYLRQMTFMPALQFILMKRAAMRFQACLRSLCLTETWNFQSWVSCPNSFCVCQQTLQSLVQSLMKPLLQRASQLARSEMVQRFDSKNSQVNFSGMTRLSASVESSLESSPRIPNIINSQKGQNGNITTLHCDCCFYSKLLFSCLKYRSSHISSRSKQGFFDFLMSSMSRKSSSSLYLRAVKLISSLTSRPSLSLQKFLLGLRCL